MVRWVVPRRFESACDEDEDKQNETNQTPADQLANTVNKLLSAPTVDKPNIAPLPAAPQKSHHNPTKLRNKELEGRREQSEISQRVQIIKRRAASCPSEMPSALDQMPAMKIDTK